MKKILRINMKNLTSTSKTRREVVKASTKKTTLTCSSLNTGVLMNHPFVERSPQITVRNIMDDSDVKETIANVMVSFPFWLRGYIRKRFRPRCLEPIWR